jgi:signal transduction histidine kinase/ActR/RegA family two-component response regulator
MKRNEKVGRLAACFLLAVVLTGILPISAKAEERKARQTVKVAVLNNTTYADQDENGVWSGMDVETMIDISQKAGFNVEFIDSSSDPDFLRNLDNGTYDIVADVAITPEREEQYLFTDEDMGTNNSTLAVRADDNRWEYGEIDQISHMKIGVLSTYANNADFRAWCAKHYVDPSITEYKTIADMTGALQGGEIDGGVYSAIAGEDYTKQFRTILKFLPEPYAFAFRKEDVELKNEVDAAVAQILSGNAGYFTDLKIKYETQFRSNILPLSFAEKKYIADHPVLRVAAVGNEMPYFRKNADGSESGIIPDYYQRLAGWTGLKFSFSVYDSYDEAQESVRNGKTDILGIYGNGLISAYQNGLSLTDSISSVSCILLTNSGADISEMKRIATAGTVSNALKPGIRRTFPGSSVTEYDNARDCFNAVRSGDADAVLVGLYSTTWLTNQMNSTAYNIVPISGINYDLCAAVREEDQTLCSILNKGIAATKGDFIGIATKDTVPQNDLSATVARISPAIAVSVVGVLLALVIGLLWAIVLLRKRQKERTAVLAAQAETERQKILLAEIKKSTDERNRFFANISHDMRTPLNAVLGFAQLAQKDDLTEETRKSYISKIQMSGGLLLELINDTLTLSKANSGKLELNPEPVRARELFESIIVPIRQAAEKKKISFTADSSGAADRVIIVDKLNFQKILLNLLSNAVKFTPEGGHVSVWFYNEARKDSGLDSIIKVSDDGIGMDPEFLPHIFEPFTQEKQNGYESVGTGLGLSIVKQMVDLMGGTIRAESEKGKGSTFTVRLHFEEAEPGADTGKEAAAPRSQDLSGKNILLCEDNPLNREISTALLKDRKMTVETAENGREGLRKFLASAPGSYDAVLMDLRMPVMDGVAAAKQIRLSGRPDAKSVPIIAMTADAFPEDIQKCLDAGMNGHLAKPVDPEQLYLTLQSAIGRKSG